MRLLSQHSWGEWALFLRELSGDNDLVMENMYLVLTFETSYNVHLEVYRLLKGCLIQRLSCNGVCVQSPDWASRKAKKRSFLKMPLLKACNEILAHAEGRTVLSGLHVSFARKKIRLNRTALVLNLFQKRC